MSLWSRLLPHFILSSSICDSVLGYLLSAKMATVDASHEAFHPDEIAARGRGDCLFSTCLWGPQLTFLRVQLLKTVTGAHFETSRWQGGLGYPDWLRQTSTDLAGLEIKPVSPETRGHAEDGEYFEVWRKVEWIWGRQTCSESLIQCALIK